MIVGECQLQNGGCIYDEEAGACAMCDEDGADVLGAYYTNKAIEERMASEDIRAAIDEARGLGTLARAKGRPRSNNPYLHEITLAPLARAWYTGWDLENEERSSKD